jgi:8-oxo-dGTP diphosphatase
MTKADRLAVLLACFGIERVVSSDSVRCVDTVRPYATVARLPVELEPRVTEESHDGDGPEPAAAVVRELLADPRPTVLCSHRPVLPTIFAALGQLPDSPFPMASVDEDPLSPGGFVVVHRSWPSPGAADPQLPEQAVAGCLPDLVATERHDP